MYVSPFIASKSALSYSEQKPLFKEILIVEVSGPDTRMSLSLFGRHQGNLESLLDSLAVGTQSRRQCGSLIPHTFVGGHTWRHTESPGAPLQLQIPGAPLRPRKADSPGRGVLA